MSTKQGGTNKFSVVQKVKSWPEEKQKAGLEKAKKLKKALVSRGEALIDSVAIGAKQLGNTVHFITHPKEFGDFVDKSAKSAKQATDATMRLLFNHLNWYTHYPIEGLVGANFARRKGIDEVGVGPIPSVCSLALQLTIPNEPTGSYDQAINIMYNRIRRANAGAVNYGPKELSAYVDSIRNIHAVYFCLRRAYATLFNFDSLDAAVPASLFCGYGLDYETFKVNAGNLRTLLVMNSNLIKELCPLNIDLISRTDWLFSNIFSDSNDAKASYYVFKLNSPRGWKLSSGAWTVDQQSTFSNYGVSSTATGATYANATAAFNALLSDFKNIEVFQIIAGDILKAYGPAAMFDNVVWGPTEHVEIVYDEAALTQIQNATILSSNGTPSFSPTIVHTMGTNGVATSIAYTAFNTPSADGLATLKLIDSPFINMYKDSITAADIISATRLKMACPESTVWNATSGPSTTSGLVNGTEVCVDARIIKQSGTTSVYKLALWNFGFHLANGVPSSTDSKNLTINWSSMDWAPMTALLSAGTSGTGDCHVLLWDFNNYAKVNVEEIGSYHAFAALSLLYVEGGVKVAQNLATYK